MLLSSRRQKRFYRISVKQTEYYFQIIATVLCELSARILISANVIKPMQDYQNIKIVSGKFDCNINLESERLKNPTERIRIGSINYKHLKSREYIPIATDGKIVLYKNKSYNVREFLSITNAQILKKLIVLTIRERNSILNELVDFDVQLSIFEIKYPIYRHIKYISNIYHNYKELKRLLKSIAKMSIKGNSLAHYISNEHLFKIERKLRFKNNLDYFFAFSYKGGYQEVFKLKEERKDRVVIAFDFNSMYIECMKGSFIEPKSIKYKDLRESEKNISQLYDGLYRVILKNPSDTFLKKFHPFKYIILNKQFYFDLEKNQEIELLLFKNEIEYYQKYFNETKIIEGLYSEKLIKHPLIENAINLYQDRLRYKKENNLIMHDLCKFKLVTMHSATNSKSYKIIHFKTKNELIDHLATKYMIDFPCNISFEKKIELIEDYKYFRFKKIIDGYEAKLINYDSNEAIFSLSAQIVANSRLKIVKTIEMFLDHKSVEICYSNVDSLHISILRSEVDNFLQKHKNIISEKLGDLKIQSIADRGYWFDVGRYWLIKDDAVVLFKNILFNHKFSKTNFTKIRKFKLICKGNLFSYIKTIHPNIENAFSYHKKVQADNQIDKCDYKRYSFSEISDLDVAGEAFNKEILNSKKIKIDLFNKIATVPVL